MYVWTEQGVANLIRQSEDFAEAAARSAGRDFEEALLGRLDFFAERCAGAFYKLLPELVAHADPFWPQLPPKMSVPEVVEPTDEELRQAAGPPPSPPKREDFQTQVSEPGMLERLFGGTERHEQRVSEQRAKDEEGFQAATRRHEKEMEEWRRRMEATRERIVEKREADRREVEEYNQGIDDTAALRESPTAPYLESVVRDSVARTFYSAMANLHLPLPGPEYIHVGASVEERRVGVRFRMPDPRALIPPEGFRATEDGPEPRPREEAGRVELQQVYGAALALGAVNVIYDLLEEASLHGLLEEVVATGFVEREEDAGGHGKEPWHLVSIQCRMEDEEKIKASAEEPVATLQELEGRLAESLDPDQGILPFEGPTPSRELKEAESG